MTDFFDTVSRDAYKEGYNDGYAAAMEKYVSFKHGVDDVISEFGFVDGDRPILTFDDFSAYVKRSSSYGKADAPQAQEPRMDDRTSTQKSRSGGSHTRSSKVPHTRAQCINDRSNGKKRLAFLVPVVGIVSVLAIVIFAIVIPRNTAAPAKPNSSPSLGEALSQKAAAKQHEKESSATATPSPTPHHTPVLSATPAVKPYNGKLLLGPLNEGVAPFSVSAPLSSDCYVRLHSYARSDNDVAFYVQAGHEAEVLVPLGTYYLYYSTGSTWYGKDADNNMVFGSDTRWYKADDMFVFYADAYTYYGHSVSLYSVLNGNLETDPVAASTLPF